MLCASLVNQLNKTKLKSLPQDETMATDMDSLIMTLDKLMKDRKLSVAVCPDSYIFSPASARLHANL